MPKIASLHKHFKPIKHNFCVLNWVNFSHSCMFELISWLWWLTLDLLNKSLNCWQIVIVFLQVNETVTFSVNLHGLRISLFSRMNFPSFLFLAGNSGTLYTYKINQTIHIFLSGSYLLFNETNSSNHCQTIEVFNKSSYIYQKVL